MTLVTSLKSRCLFLCGFVNSTLFYLRSNHSEVFYKNGVLKNFTIFTRKHLCQSLFFNKVAGLRPEIFKNTFIIEQLRWLLLLFISSKSFYYMALDNCYNKYFWKGNVSQNCNKLDKTFFMKILTLHIFKGLC